jgi:rubrerythrin
MTYLFCDTCVLLNLSTDIKLYDAVVKILELVEKGEIKVVMSDIVKSELTTHKETIVNKRIASYNSHLKNTKNLYELFSEETEIILRKEIQDIHAELPKMESVLNKNLDEVLKLTGKSTQINHTQEHKNNVIQRAIDKTFPFHRNKNSIKDALISESFIEFTKQLPADCDKVYFITDNVDDFSDVSNKTLPHPDWADNFNDDIIYSINIAAVINTVEPESIEKEVEEEIQERSTDVCVDGKNHSFDTENGFWKNSMYGGGLSWHYRCKKCGITYDTGDYWN